MLSLKSIVFPSSYLNRVALRCVTTAKVSVKEDSSPVKSYQDIPGPPSLPFFGPLLNFLPGIGSLTDVVGYELSDTLYKKYGPIVRVEGLLGRPDFVFLFDAEAISIVLRNENTMPIRPGFQSLDYFRKQYGKFKYKENKITGLITDHGASWKNLRSTVNPVLLQPKTIKLYQSALDEVAVDMIARMKMIRDEDNMIRENFDIEMNRWSLESIGVVALGGRIGCLDPDLPEDSPARQLIQCVHDIFEYGNKLDFKPSMWRYYATKDFKTAMNLYQQQIDLSMYFINRARKDFERRDRSVGQDEKGVLEKLLEINEDVALIMASDMLMAGVDTAANTIIATLYLLATNEDKQDKLREEILAEPDRHPYLRACIKESLRMMPVVAGNVRQSTKEYNLCGYTIPVGKTFVFNHEYLSKMESEFPQASQFLPERWVVEKSSPLHHGRAHPFAMSPFGFGVRQCVGRRIADLELETFLQRLMRSFRVTLRGPPPRVQPTSLNYIVGPYNFAFKDVEG